MLLVLTIAGLTATDNVSRRPDTVLVKTQYGILRGYLNYTLYENRTFYSFRGIPYAKPPLGKLRFKVNFSDNFYFIKKYYLTIFQIQPPKKATSWTGIRDANAFGIQCVQNNTGAEDCLFLNVFTPGKVQTIIFIRKLKCLRDKTNCEDRKIRNVKVFRAVLGLQLILGIIIYGSTLIFNQFIAIDPYIDSQFFPASLEEQFCYFKTLKFA